MTSSELENLARAGNLKREPADQAEFDGLVRSGAARLADAQTPGLSLEGRFDLAYNASHALALAALRWRVLDKGHSLRNLSEYEGQLQVDERFLHAFVEAAIRLEEVVMRLGPVPEDDAGRFAG
jgi:hypothetical protein